MLYPIKNEEGLVLAILEIANNNTGRFEHDDEYITELILTVLQQSVLRALTKSSVIAISRMKEDLVRAAGFMVTCRDISSLLSAAKYWIDIIFTGARPDIFIVTAEGFLRESGEIVEFNIGIAGHVLEKMTPELVTSPYDDPRFNSKTDLQSSLPVFFFPVVKDEEKAIGIIQLSQVSLSAKEDSLIKVNPNMIVILNLFVKIFVPCVEVCMGWR